MSIKDLLEKGYHVNEALPDSSEFTKSQLDDALYLLKSLKRISDGLFNPDNDDEISGADVVEEICHQANEMDMWLWVEKL